MDGEVAVDDVFVQYHDRVVHVLLRHWHPPAIHDGHESAAQGVPARKRAVHPGHAFVVSPNLQKAQPFMRTTVRLLRYRLKARNRSDESESMHPAFLVH